MERILIFSAIICGLLFGCTPAEQKLSLKEVVGQSQKGDTLTIKLVSAYLTPDSSWVTNWEMEKESYVFDTDDITPFRKWKQKDLVALYMGYVPIGEWGLVSINEVCEE
jgi:hypothetical protein